MNSLLYEYPVNTDTESALVVFSGGQDSTTCLVWAKERFKNVIALSVNYGQKHSIELECARKITDTLQVPHEIINVPNILQGTSPLVNPGERLEMYADAESLPGGLEKTFVPMRNQLFLTIAANRAYVKGIRNLVTGICQADSGGYPDCREDFKNSLQLTTNLGTFTGEPGTVDKLKIHTPLMHLSKAQSIELAIDVGAYEILQHTHTAYDGKYPPESHDHANLLRAGGFEEADLPDPLVVRAWYGGLMELPTTHNYMAIRGILASSSYDGDLQELLTRVADEHVRNRNKGACSEST